MFYPNRKIPVCITICLAAIIISMNVYSKAAKKTAPPFAIFDQQDNLVSMSSLTKQNNLIISFWASYCVPCKKEIPQLVELEKKYATMKNIKLVLINIDKEGKEKAKPVLEELNVESLCLNDIYQINTKKYIPDLKIPAVFLVNMKNEIIFETVGENAANMRNLENAIKRMK